MKIYTKTGDDGTTSLVGGTRVSKASLRLEAYGTADELNSFIGLMRAKQTDKQIDEMLDYLQNKLFNLGTVLATEPDSKRLQMVKDLFITEKEVQTIEQHIDLLEEPLQPIHSFILPAGSESIATAHICRTVARRLERRMVELQQELEHDNTDQKAIDTLKTSLQFVNRISDFFFILAKNIAQTTKTSVFLWKK